MKNEKIPININPPQDSSYQEHLRFYCQTSDPENPNLNFMVSMWSYSIAKGVLTGQQHKNASYHINQNLKLYGLEGVEFNGK